MAGEGMAASPLRRPLHIAMVGQKGLPATFGGIEHHVEHLSRRLVRRGHRVTVYCRSSYGEIPARSYHGIDLVPAATVGTKHLDAIVHSATSTAKALLSSADVVHYHGIGPGLVAPLPRYASRAKVVMTIHGLDHQRSKWGRGAQAVLGAAHWMSGHVPDEVVVVSRALEQHYWEHFDRRAHLIQNGVVEAAQVPPSALPAGHGLEPGKYALFVGRLVPEKRPDLLIEAFRRVPGDHRLAIVGDSSYTSDFTRRLHQLAASDPRVVFTGFMFGEQLAALYQHAGVFVQPSALEGLPLTLLEAVANDAPVLVSDISPHLEVVGEGSARHQVVPVDSVDSLAGAVSLMLQHPRPRDAASRCLREAILARHSWDASVDALEALYLRTVNGRSAEDPPSAPPGPRSRVPHQRAASA
ncbi:glycosyltransferase family 4 protein [Knoellia sp. 3-2P3]|uniref:glycosyltransferase family 4 protein n=1 Tax=unclassified Knoellia TaxID=2618719 RepID=UPI0023DCD74B|nr:glycosyltransferase family 4 protein [Knoellia sp. 3-2P3]MDF2093730.1 glycosyltransferase family 4 protein [Knoellia sp. 3-2P3]